jgi:hypothetical protein
MELPKRFSPIQAAVVYVEQHVIGFLNRDRRVAFDVMEVIVEVKIRRGHPSGVRKIERRALNALTETLQPRQLFNQPRTERLEIDRAVHDRQERPVARRRRGFNEKERGI